MSVRPLSRVRRNICVLLLAFLALSWGYFIFSFNRSYRTIEQQCENHLTTLSIGFEEHTRHVVQMVDVLLLEISRHFSQYSGPELQETFNDWFKRSPELAILAVVDIHSGETLISLNNKALPESFRPDDFAGSVQQRTGLQISAQVYTGSDGRHQVAVSRQFQWQGRNLQVVFFLYTDRFLAFHPGLDLGEKYSVGIFHEQGLLLARYPEAQLVGHSFANSSLFTDLLPHSLSGIDKNTELAGGSRIVAYRKVVDQPFVVTVGTSLNSTFADWQSRLLNFLIIQLIVSFTIIVSLVVLFRTLSRVQKAEIGLEEREEHFRSMANSSVDAVISVDTHERVSFWSVGAEKAFGCLSVEALNMPITCFLQFADQGNPLTLKQLTEFNSPWSNSRTLDVQGQRKNGEIFPTELSISRGTVSGNILYTLIVRDVTERKQMEERVRRMASHDNLTGLPNRGLLMDRLQVAMAQVRRQGGQFALLFIDLDQFKPVNDQYGHDAGDKLLQQVAKRMLATVRASDTVARVGGDEFAILLTNVEDQASVERACEHLLAALRRKFIILQNPIDISCSIGVVLFSGQDKTAIELIGCADSAMYAAKRAGKNRYFFNEPEG